MDRPLLRACEGFTLLELLIALALGSVILLTASNFLVNYAKFSSNVIKAESSLMSTSLAVFEEIVDKIGFANKAVCGAEAAMDIPAVARPAGCLTDGTCVQLRCAHIAATNTPSTFSDDDVYTYWKDTNVPANLHRKVDGATTLGDTIIATGINTFQVFRVDTNNSASNTNLNTIRVQLGVDTSDITNQATSGSQKEYMDTTIVMREKSFSA